MADDEQFSLCWNNFNSNLSAGFHESLCRGDLVDVTLAAEGQFVKAHRLVLSVCSPYFRKMFTQMPANQHAFVFLKDVSHTALKDLIQFMYCGEVNVKQEALPAFISTAEALQIKGLTDSDPPPAQSPAAEPAPQPQIQQISTSPRVRQTQRTSTTRSYKIETVDDSIDDKQATQIVIQTAAPQATITQSQHLQQTQHHPTQQIPSTATTTVVTTHKRPAQRSIGSAPHIKRTKSTIDPLEAAEATAAQQIAVQAAVVAADNKVQQAEAEYIDLPIELPPKSEPDYTEDTGDVDGGDNEATYVEDDSYGDMRYDESYFTENEEGPSATAVGGSVSGSSATTSKAIVKSQQSLSESSYIEAGDQTNNDAQDYKEHIEIEQAGLHEVKFIRSQKKNAQLVYNGFIYNKKLTQANGHTTWRCIDVLKLRCKAVVITKRNELVAARREHNHFDHMARIRQRPLYNVEEDLGEYIEIKADDPKLAEYISVSEIEFSPQKNGKEYKVYVPATHKLQSSHFDKF